MDIKSQVKGLKIGNIVITTQKQLDNRVITLEIEPKEVWDLFIKALKEDKIRFEDNKDVHKN